MKAKNRLELILVYINSYRSRKISNNKQNLKVSIRSSTRDRRIIHHMNLLVARVEQNNGNEWLNARYPIGIIRNILNILKPREIVNSVRKVTNPASQGHAIYLLVY